MMFWSRSSSPGPGALGAAAVAATTTAPPEGGSSSSSSRPSVGRQPAAPSGLQGGGFLAALWKDDPEPDARPPPPPPRQQLAGEGPTETDRSDPLLPPYEALAPSALPMSHVLSDRRRQELLAAARSSRLAWVDGGGDHAGLVLPMASASTSASSSATSSSSLRSLPRPCQEAVRAIREDLGDFLTQLADLPRQLAPSEISQLQDPRDAADRGTPVDNNRDHETPRRISLVDELRQHEPELAQWKASTALADGGRLTIPQRRRMTARDKELLFLAAAEELLRLLKHPLAAELVYQIQLFVQSVEHWDLRTMHQHRAAHERPGGRVHAFIDRLIQRLGRPEQRLHEAFEALGLTILRLEDDEEQWLHEALEAFVMEKLYSKLITPTEKTEVEDHELQLRLETLGFVTFRHLELPEPATEAVENQWERLIEQLRDLPKYMSPRRKMDCILQVCQDLTSLLSGLYADGRFPSADEFLPGLIYLLLKANPPELKRNVNFILEYRHPNRLVSEPGYFFTHLVSSVAFLEQVNSQLLTISPEEFEEGVRRNKARIMIRELSQDIGASNARSSTVTSVSQCGPIYPSVHDVRARRLSAQAISP